MQPQRAGTFISVEDYLDGEQDSQIRHEYVDGEVYAMVGVSDRHALIAGNLFTVFNTRLPEHCQPFISDMKVHIRVEEKDIFYYPDILVSCDAKDRETYYRERPCLIIEVLSPGTARLDRFEKHIFYRHLETLEEYVLVSQDFRLVEVFRRCDDWQATLYRKDDLVTFRSVGIEVGMDQIYRRTDR
jgi:Uma2 family endonuclease